MQICASILIRRPILFRQNSGYTLKSNNPPSIVIERQFRSPRFHAASIGQRERLQDFHKLCVRFAKVSSSKRSRSNAENRDVWPLQTLSFRFINDPIP